MQEISLTSEVERAKKVRVYRNGDDNFFGKDLVINRRQIRTYDSFLNSVTQHISMSEQVRSIRTPRGRTIITSLDQLQDKNDYVAVGLGRFKDLGYGTLHTRHSLKLQKLKRRKEETVRPNENDQYKDTASKVNKPIKEVVSIYVYCNGDVYEPAKRIVLTPRMMTSWNLVFAEIHAHLNPHFGALRMLCTLDGTELIDLSELQTGTYYVALSRYMNFKLLDYGASKKVFTLTGKPSSKQYDVLNESLPVGGSSSVPDDNSEAAVAVTSRRVQSDSGAEHQPDNHEHDRPRQARNKTGQRQPRLLYSDGRDVFPMKARKVRRNQTTSSTTTSQQDYSNYKSTTSQQDYDNYKSAKSQRDYNNDVIDLDRDEGGVFKAKGEGRRETVGAVEIREATPTPRQPQIERPTDIDTAPQVDEEEINFEQNNRVYLPTPPAQQRPPNRRNGGEGGGAPRRGSYPARGGGGGGARRRVSNPGAGRGSKRDSAAGPSYNDAAIGPEDSRDTTLTNQNGELVFGGGVKDQYPAQTREAAAAARIQASYRDYQSRARPGQSGDGGGVNGGGDTGQEGVARNEQIKVGVDELNTELATVTNTGESQGAGAAQAADVTNDVTADVTGTADVTADMTTDTSAAAPAAVVVDLSSTNEAATAAGESTNQNAEIMQEGGATSSG